MVSFFPKISSPFNLQGHTQKKKNLTVLSRFYDVISRGGKKRFWTWQSLLTKGFKSSLPVEDKVDRPIFLLLGFFMSNAAF